MLADHGQVSRQGKHQVIGLVERAHTADYSCMRTQSGSWHQTVFWGAAHLTCTDQDQACAPLVTA
jgi:hypothetical protein